MSEVDEFEKKIQELENSDINAEYNKSVIHIKLSEELRNNMIQLVECGLFTGYNEIVRDALRHSIEIYREKGIIKPIENMPATTPEKFL